MTYLGLLKSGIQVLEDGGLSGARRDAEILLSDLLCLEIPRLYIEANQSVSEEQKAALLARITRRLCREPVAYITGRQAFWQHDFYVTKDTLIPRPDTETLVEAVLDRVEEHSNSNVLDLGTGSGCILLSILSERLGMTGIGVDISACAIDVARKNAVNLRLSDRAKFVRSNWLDRVKTPSGGFDIIVSNPPYIKQGDMVKLADDIRLYEPDTALVAGDDGLDIYRIFARDLAAILKPGGFVAMEIGHDQGSLVVDLMLKSGWGNVTLLPDINTKDRVVVATCG